MNILRNLDSILITNPTNIRYLTGFVGVERRDSYVLLTKDTTYFFTSALYMEQAKKLSPIPISATTPISGQLRMLCEKLSITKLGFEESDLTVAELRKLTDTLTDVTLIPTQKRIEEVRQIKRPDEIANIKKACNITDACFDFIVARLTPGVEEAATAWEIQTFFRNNNAEAAFSPIVAFNKNSSQPHYLSTNHEPLTMNSLVLLDFGARVNGYCADMTRVIFLGPPKPEWKVAYDAVLLAQKKAIGLLGDGVRNGATLDAAAKEVIAEAGLPPYPHSLGHNVGLDIHEGPRLSDKKEETLLPGMVFSVEPGVYIEGQYGIRIEDLVRLTDNGIEILSKSPKELTIL